MESQKANNSKRGLSSEDVAALLNSSDFSDISDVSNIEEEDDFDSDDSFADKNWYPTANDENEIEKELAEAFDISRNTSHLPKTNKRHKTDLTENIPVASAEVEKSEILGKNGYVWNNFPLHGEGGKCASRNIIFIPPGPTIKAKQSIEPEDIFNLFMTEDILNTILNHTNLKISQLRQKYKLQNSTISDLNLVELKALLGLLLLSAALKSNHLTADLLFDTSYSGDRYRTTMSKDRFKFLLNALRFDDPTTREERKKETSFTPISEIWENFIDKCNIHFKPGSYVTIDEQLVGFRGRCPFKMYIPNKPNKFGIKIVMLCDNSTKYVINAEPYLGKSTKTEGKPLATYYVEKLTKPLYGSSRNITMDNWFTSIPLARNLLEKPYKLTVVGTLRKNKAEIPPELLDLKSQGTGSSRFVYDKNITLVSFKPKQNKNVLLISTMHLSGALNSTTGKPEIVHTYNSTKGAVDTFDQMAQNMCCNRKTRRWPLCFFYNMLNIASVNAYVIYSYNAVQKGIKPMNRIKFMLNLQEQLTRPWQEQRLSTTINLPSKLKQNIKNNLQINSACEEPSQNKGKRTYCKYCHYSKKRMTTTYCHICKNAALCGEHQIKICKDCINQD